MESVRIMYYLAIILIVAKSFGLLARKLGLPQVAGMVIGGLILGLLSNLHNDNNFILQFLIKPTESEGEVLEVFSQVGVVLILFSSGLETKFSDLKKSGFASSCIALVGVVIPIAAGTLIALMFMRGFGETYTHEKFLNAMFVGTILSATSVGITVETLKELGRLNGKVGQTVVSAAIIDDVIGIIALSILTSLSSGGASQIWITIVKVIGFFLFAIGFGILFRMFFKSESKSHPHKRRLGIHALAMCFFYAFCAEHFFGVAAITGAYMAGMMLSGMNDTDFVDKKAEESGYLIFSPVFFSYIGLSADFSGFSWGYLLFAVTFIVVGILSKIVGCGAVSKTFKYKNKECLQIGVGMIARGEVALAVYAAGSSLIVADGGIDPLVATIMLIVVSSILCPILLKLLFKNSNTTPTNDGNKTFLQNDEVDLINQSVHTDTIDANGNL